MTIRKIQKIFAGVLTVSVLTASLFGGSALASETETVSETTTETASEAGSEESTGTRTIVDHTGAEGCSSGEDRACRNFLHPSPSFCILPVPWKRR